MFMLGMEYTDTLTLSNGVVIPEQSIGVADKRGGLGLHGADGIFGLGPVGLTKATLNNDPQASIPTIIDNLLTQGTITQNVVSFFFAPMLQTSITYGTITLGGIDPTDVTSSITYT